MPRPPKRQPAEQARREILEHAELLLLDHGPDALKLERIAKSMGSTHSRILHHFGSRNALLEALLDHGRQKILSSKLDAIEGLDRKPANDTELVELLADVSNQIVASDRRTRIPELMAALKVYGVRLDQEAEGTYDDIIAVLHLLRGAFAAKRGLTAPTEDDSRFLIVLAVFCLFAEGTIGDEIRNAARCGDPVESRKRFWDWFAEMLATRDFGPADAA